MLEAYTGGPPAPRALRATPDGTAAPRSHCPRAEVGCRPSTAHPGRSARAGPPVSGSPHSRGRPGGLRFFPPSFQLSPRPSSRGGAFFMCPLFAASQRAACAVHTGASTGAHIGAPISTPVSHGGPRPPSRPQRQTHPSVAGCDCPGSCGLRCRPAGAFSAASAPVASSGRTYCRAPARPPLRSGRPHGRSRVSCPALSSHTARHAPRVLPRRSGVVARAWGCVPAVRCSRPCYR